MKSNNYQTPVLFAAGLSLLLTSISQPQDKDKSSLEQRVETLERKVEMLQTQVTYLAGIGARGGTASYTQIMMRNEMTNIGFRAWQYLNTPTSRAGGGGTYKGFSLPPHAAKTNYGSYSVSPGDTEVVIEGEALHFSGKMRAVAGFGGRLRDWSMSGDFVNPNAVAFAGGSNRQMDLAVVTNEIDKIAAHVYGYRIRPTSMGGGAGSYRGYTLPKEMRSTALAWYAVSVSDTNVVIEGRQKRYNDVRLAFVDRDGKTVRTDGNTPGDMKKPTGGFRTASDSLRERITGDLVGIAARAFQYKTSPAESGGGGKYTGYLSAQTGSMDGAANYDLFVDPDAMLLRASLVNGTGTMSVKVESNGKLSGWYSSGDLAR